MNILVDLHEEGRGIMLITHDNDIAEKASRRLRMLDGKIEFDSADGGESA